MSKEDMIKQIEKINNNSLELKRARRIRGSEYKDENGGHIEYANKDDSQFIADDAFYSILENCAAGLGIKYEHG